MKTFPYLLAGTMLGSGLFSGTAAWAGTEPLYQPAPDWVEPASMPADISGPPIVLLDDQRRIEEGLLLSYQDRAIRIDNPQMLNSAGTLQAAWLPDKGDLIVHNVSILRDGESIDVLEDGARFDVLRRERQLERRMIDGVYTATMPVPGLRVGDVLRVSYTVTSSDQALDKEVQALAPLMSAPFEAGFARVRMSWSDDADVQWQVSEGVDIIGPTSSDGFTAVEVNLPLEERPEMPEDAPIRYQVPPLLQAGTFDDWKEVSAVMTPLYATEGTIEPGGAIAGEVATIEAQHSGELERAVAALRLVQDEVAYLLNGMDGGNYLPQSPAETWEMRYGDCKAKSLLLLAMLREMDIEAEAVVVASQIGDAVPEMLPMPGAFDHVIVRAVIDGTEYWLDGTSSGASMAVVEEVPTFHVGLPLREGGSGLIPMEQRPQTAFDRVSQITFDHRAGLDLPMLFEGEWLLRGTLAAPIRTAIGQASDAQIDEYLQGFAASIIGPGHIVDSKIDYDPDSNTASIWLSGLQQSVWEWDRGKAERGFGLPSSSFRFRPDRARAAWQDIPVAVPGPFSEEMELTVLLPDGAEGFALEGAEAYSEEIANIQIKRSSALEEGQLVVTDSAAWPGGELTAEEAAEERRRAVRFGSTALRLQSPEGMPRSFDVVTEGRERFAPIEQAYAQLIAKDPDETALYAERAWFRSVTLDRQGALADFDRMIELEASASTYLARSGLLKEMGRLEDALADAEMAWELYPSIDAAFAQADILPYLGRAEEAIALLEDQSGDADERRQIATSLSDLEALLGRKDDGLQRIEDILVRRPGDPEVLNAKCWYQATWNMETDDLTELCTEAVEKSDWAPHVLDSRAMSYYRMGRLEDSLRDLEAALASNPDQVPSLFMRGIVRRELGDNGGEADIRKALRRQPSLERYFARFGIEAD